MTDLRRGAVGPPRTGRSFDGVEPDLCIGVGGIGWGQFFRLAGRRTIGRNESRSAKLVDARDYCKLHIVFHWLAALTADRSPSPPRIVPIGAVGDDAPGRRLLGEMAAIGLETLHVDVVPGRPSTYSVAFQYPDGAGCNVTTSNGASASLSAAHVANAARSLAGGSERIVGVALPEVPLPIRLAFLASLDESAALRVASFTSAELRDAVRRHLLDRVDLIALNEDEAASFLGRPFDPDRLDAFLETLGTRLGVLRPDIQVILTAGTLGAFAFSAGRWDHCPAPATLVLSTAGAGDALLAGVLAGRFAGLPLAEPSRTGLPLAVRGIGTALDVGVLAATYKLGARDTIPADVSHAALIEEARRLGVSDLHWPVEGSTSPVPAASAGAQT